MLTVGDLYLVGTKVMMTAALSGSRTTQPDVGSEPLMWYSSAVFMRK